MSAPLQRGRALALQRVLGLLFILTLVFAVWLTAAIYQQRFTPTTDLLLLADRAGNQLSQGADVKARGLIVGRVASIRSTGDGAELELAIDRDKSPLIPRNVEARLLPKTLFGEKFVALVVPDEPAEPVRNGDVIEQDRSETARETQEALDGLLPLLQELRPEALSTTLNAVSSALRGRGDRIGENLVLVDDYLRELNPELPELQRANAGLADFVDTLDTATPDLLEVLDNTAFTSRSLVDQAGALERFLVSTTGFSDEAGDVLRENEQRLITLAADSVPVLQVYAEYSNLFPCLAAGLTETHPLISDSFGGRQPGLHITLEFIDNNGPFVEGDQPAYRETLNTECRGLPPNAPERPFPFFDNPKDGYREGRECEESTGDCGPPDGIREPTYPHERETRSESVSAQSGVSPTEHPARALAGDRAFTKAILGAATGSSAREVPDIAALLFEPMTNGAAVRLSPR